MIRSFIVISGHLRNNRNRIPIFAVFNRYSFPLHSVRVFSKSSNDEGSKTEKERNAKDSVADDGDPFGVKNEDGENNLGPLPPQYKRDPITGKFTGEKVAEIDEEERRLLNMSQEDSIDLLQRRLITRSDWGEEKENEIAQQIRDEEAAYSVIGRKISQIKGEEKHSAPLNLSEFDSFQEFMKHENATDVTKDDIHVQELGSPASPNDANWRDHDHQQNKTWLKNKDSSEPDNWMKEIMPWHLAPRTKVNRREAKPIPKKLLHHNNLELLRRYVTPGGQILNRRLSRLGAKDQRKIAKLIKRSRQIGLIPSVGQWRLEDKGPIHIPKEKFSYEKELEKMGLSLPPSPPSYKDVLES